MEPRSSKSSLVFVWAWSHCTCSGAWRACSGVGRLAMVGLRAGHRVGEEVRQRTQPRHNRVGLRRPKLSGASLLSSTSSYVSSSTIQDSTLRPHVQKRFWRWGGLGGWCRTSWRSWRRWWCDRRDVATGGGGSRGRLQAPSATQSPKSVAASPQTSRELNSGRNDSKRETRLKVAETHMQLGQLSAQT